MKLLNDKRGFVDPETLMSPGFVILVLFAWSATLIGYFGGKSMGMEAVPLTTLLILLVGELVACYVVAIKMFD